MFDHADYKARKRAEAIIELEILKTDLVSDQLGMDAEERLIVTVVLLYRLKNPAEGPSYAEIAKRIDHVVSERTVGRRCKRLEEAGILKRLDSGLAVVGAERFYETAEAVYDLYQGKIAETEAEIADARVPS